MRSAGRWLAVAMAVGSSCGTPGVDAEPSAEPTARAVGYLEREAPRWQPSHGCFSCHHDGDATRAVLLASSLRGRPAPGSLTRTVEFLSAPDRWDHNGTEGPFSDADLARIQFGAALVAAVDAGAIDDPGALDRAAALVAASQRADGSFRLEGDQGIGSPAAYGRFLATAMAVATLERSAGFADEVGRARDWLRSTPVENVTAASGALLGLAAASDDAGRQKASECIDVILEGQSSAGGWGPYRATRPEVFDTALAVIALSRFVERPGVRAAIVRGREYLIAEQEPDGSWVETTRPSGYDSDAQHLSTCGWATQALLVTDRMRP